MIRSKSVRRNVGNPSGQLEVLAGTGPPGAVSIWVSHGASAWAGSVLVSQVSKSGSELGDPVWQSAPEPHGRCGLGEKTAVEIFDAGFSSKEASRNAQATEARPSCVKSFSQARQEA